MLVFWGTPAWDQWAGLITRVLPEFPIVDVAPADPIRHALFNITEVKQVPSIFSWAGPGSAPRERGNDSPHANFRAIADGDGRIMVAMTHNTDIGDSMERETIQRTSRRSPLTVMHWRRTSCCMR